MLPSALQSAPSPQYVAAVERADEMERLQAQARKRKSMLVFGPEGVGKTRLLQSFVKTLPLALYVGHTSSPRDLMLALVEDLQSLAKRELRLPAAPRSLSTSSLKGMVQRALDHCPFLLVLDHLSGPSRVATGLIKELNYYGRTPVFFVARTPHMEDIGALQPMCADRSERTELKNFPSTIALEFAQREAEKTALWASNLDHALHSLVEWSEGNPGAILKMIEMAHLPKYRMDDQIKAHVLYLDYRMGRR
jgi:GTPase SAR1 family protein